MCLKQSFSHSKWDLQAILSLTVFQTVFQAVQNLTPLFSLTVPNVVGLFMLLDRKFNEDSKTVIFLLQLGFTGNFVPKLSFRTVSLAAQILTLLFSLTVSDFVVFFFVIK